jgi:hypothetical protein
LDYLLKQSALYIKAGRRNYSATKIFIASFQETTKVVSAMVLVVITVEECR